MKNKKIIIISVILIFVALSVLGVLYFTTDIFKTNQQLFYKYLAKTNIIDSNFVSQYNIVNSKIAKNSNSSTMNIDVMSSTLNQETGIADVQNLFTIKSNGLENALLKQSYRDFTISSGTQDFLTLKYIRDDNTYAIGADNILAKYIAVENNNLKDLVAKFGVEDTTNVPNSIPTNLNEILKVDEATLSQLKERYGTLIYNNISEENFYKIINDDRTETIGMELTEQELKSLIILILENVQNDSTLLNFIMERNNLLGIDGLTIEKIQTELQEYIDDLKQENSTEEDGWTRSGINEYEKKINRVIQFALIKKEKEVIGINFETTYTKQIKTYESIISDNFDLTEEKIVDTIKLDFSKDNNVDIYIKENNVEITKANLNYSCSSNNFTTTLTMEFKEDDKTQSIKMQHQTNDIQTDNVTQNSVIDINNNEENYQIGITNNIVFKQDIIISKLTTENSAKLNDMTTEEIAQLITALGNRINQLYGINLEV